MFISGFSFCFVVPFFFNFLASINAIGKSEAFEADNISYAGLIFKFEFFTFSYLLQISGIIILIFLWLKNNYKGDNKIFLEKLKSIICSLCFKLSLSKRVSKLSLLTLILR